MVSRRASLFGAGTISAVWLAFFSPLFQNNAFSVIPYHQFGILPWAAMPHPQFEVAFPQSDQADAFYPWQTFINRSIRDGELPLWNPLSFGGHPFLNGQNAVFYPPKLLLSATLSPDAVHDVLIASHVLVSGLAMFFLARELDLRLWGSLLASCSWMLNPFTFAWIQLEFAAVIAAFLPLCILAILRMNKFGSLSTAAIGGACLGMVMLGAHVLFASLVWTVSFFYAACLALRRIWRAPTERSITRMRQVQMLAVLFIIALSTCAISLFPTLELAIVGRSNFDYHLIKQFTADPKVFFHTFFSPALPISQEKMHQMTFVGLPTAILAFGGLFRRRTGAGFAATLCTGVFLVAIGTPLTFIAYKVIPGFQYFRPLGRAFFLWGFAVALLGGFGLDRLLGFLNSRIHSSNGRVTDSSGKSKGKSTLSRSNWLVEILGALLILGTVVQLSIYNREINPPFHPRRSDLIFPATPLIRMLQSAQQNDPFQRIAPITRSPDKNGVYPPILYASHAMIFGLESVGGYDSMVPWRTAAIWRVVAGESPKRAVGDRLSSAFVPTFYSGQLRFELLSRLAVNTLVTSPNFEIDPTWSGANNLKIGSIHHSTEGKIFGLQEIRPRAYFVSDAKSARSPLEALEWFTDPEFNDQETVILEHRDQINRRPATIPPAETAKISVQGRKNDFLKLSVSAPEAGWLVLLDTFDPGWNATVNGDSARLLRANFAFKAVAVPKGPSIIELNYRPKSFVVGAIISLSTVGIGLFHGSRSLRRALSKKKSPAGEVAYGRLHL